MTSFFVINRRKMELIEIVAIGIGLAIDVFVVSNCKGLVMKNEL